MPMNLWVLSGIAVMVAGFALRVTRCWSCYSLLLPAGSPPGLIRSR